MDNIIRLKPPASQGNFTLPLTPFEKLQKLLAGVTPKKPILPLHLGEPDGRLPDFLMPTLTKEAEGFAHYSQAVGEEALRQAIKQWADSRFHLHKNLLSSDIADNNILPTTGSREGLAIAITYAIKKKSSRLDRGQTPLAIMTNPFYHVYHTATLLAGGEAMAIHCYDEDNTDAYGVAKKLSPYQIIKDLPAEDKARLAVIIVATPDNPTGRSLHLQEMENIHDFAQGAGAMVISDECYSDIYYDDLPPISFLNLADNGFGLKNIIITNSLSKRVGLPGLRAGVLLGDRAVIGELTTWRGHVSAIPPQPLQMVAAQSWLDNQTPMLLRQAYQQRLTIASDIIGDSPSFQKPDGGFFLYLKCHDGPATAKHIFAETGIKLLPAIFMAGGDAQDDNNPAYHYLRLAMIRGGDEWRDALTAIKPFLLP